MQTSGFQFPARSLQSSARADGLCARWLTHRRTVRCRNEATANSSNMHNATHCTLPHTSEALSLQNAIVASVRKDGAFSLFQLTADSSQLRADVIFGRQTSALHRPPLRASIRARAQPGPLDHFTRTCSRARRSLRADPCPPPGPAAPDDDQSHSLALAGRGRPGLPRTRARDRDAFR